MSTQALSVGQSVEQSVPRLAEERRHTDRPSSLACTQCRKKHQKCNGATPYCARCKEDRIPCSYVQSRRGGKRKTPALPAESQRLAQRPHIRTALNGELVAADYNAWNDGWLDQTVLEPMPSGMSNLLNPRTDEACVPPTQPTSRPSASETFPLSSTPSQFVSEEMSTKVVDECLIDLYYECFHHTHPILVPKHMFVELTCPPYLRSVMQYIGSHYVNSVPRQSLRTIAGVELSRSQERSPSMVQAKLLYSIVLRANNENEESEIMLRDAMELAIALGMNKKEFSDGTLQQQPFEAESFRRTWWELYINECLTDLLWRVSDAPGHNTDCDVSMPCEEPIYAEATQIPSPVTMEEFETRLFASDDRNFSSFTYRIEAARLLARVSRVCHGTRMPKDKVQAVDNALMSWVHHIPSEKLLVIDDYGRIDEMLLQAHMMVQCATIALNLPRSCLPANTSFLNATLPATRMWRPSMAISTPQIHALKTTEASKYLSNLLSLCPSMQKHSPTIIASLVLCSVVQLSTYRFHSRSRDCLEQHRDRVTLILGLLKSIDGLWESARTAQQQLKKTAADTFWTKTIPVSTSQSGSHDIQIGTGCSTSEEFSWVSSLNFQDLSWMSPVSPAGPMS